MTRVIRDAFDAMEFYLGNEALLVEVLDDMVKVATETTPGETPALAFAALVETFSRDPQRAITLAALAIMRLAEAGKSGGAS